MADLDMVKVVRLLDANVVMMGQLSNGMRILVIGADARSGIAQVQIDVRVGDVNEGMQGDGKRECAHFLEHLVASRLFSDKYDGTAAGRDAKKWVEDHGIESNAFTSAVRTSHYMAGLADFLHDMIDIQIGAIADFPKHFEKLTRANGGEASAFAKEAAAVQRELNSKIDDPEYVIYEGMNRTLFAGNPRSVPQSFDSANVVKLTPKTVLDFFTKHYVARNMMITVAAPLKMCDIAGIMNKLEYFRFAAADPPPYQVAKANFSVASPPNFIKMATSSTVHVIFAWPIALSMYEKNIEKQRQVAALSAVTYMLTGGFTSRLLGRLRVKEGMVYSVSADASLDERSEGLGFYEISTSVDAANVTKLIENVFAELKKLADDGPTADELAKYKISVTTSIYRRIQNRMPSKWVDEYSNMALFADDKDYDSSQQLEELAYSISKRSTQALMLTSTGIQEMARRLFEEESKRMLFTYAYTTPIPGIEETLKRVISL